MGHRTSLYIRQEGTAETLFEGNNLLPFFWVTLLDKDLVAGKTAAWQQLEQLIDDETDNAISAPGLTSPDIHIRQDVLEANIARGRLYIESALPELSDFYRQFTDYLLAKTTTVKNGVYLDIIRIANFSDVASFTYDLYRMLDAFETHNSESAGIGTDKISFTGFPAHKDFTLPETPELGHFLRSQQRLQQQRDDQHRRQNIPKTGNLWLWYGGILFGLLFLAASYRGYKKEGLSYMVIAIHLWGWVSFITGLYQLLWKRWRNN